MTVHRMILIVALLALVLPAGAGAQQREPIPPPNEPSRDTGPLDQVIYRKERMEEYRKEVERIRRLREMEAWDNQRRVVKRELLNVHCTWKHFKGKPITKVFKRRIAPSCKDAIAELSRDLGRPLSADCTCTGASPTAESP
ncbi:MAG: hypothetical protein ACE5H5_02560 [Nitrospinota bacterium]